MSTLLAAELPRWLETLTSAMTNVIGPILILVATAGIIYAIVVGVKFVRAEDKSQRDEAKAKLISVIIGIVVTGVLIALFYWLSYALKEGIIDFKNYWGTDNSGSADSVIGVFKTFIK